MKPVFSLQRKVLSVSHLSSAVSVLEPVDDVGADAVEALPAVLSGETGSRGIGHLCGTRDDLHGLLGRPPDVIAFAWRRLDGLGLSGFTLLLDGFGHFDGHPGSGRQEGHLGFIWVFPAHMWAVNLVSLAGMAQLPHVPHNLGEVVARVGDVGPAEVGFALKVAGI